MNIEFTSNPSASEAKYLTERINAESIKLGVKETLRQFGFFIRNSNSEIIAGCNGWIVYNAIYTDQLWVHEDLRGQGIGTELMKRVHEYGREIRCKMATICTMSFQAPKFYLKLGYIIEFTREGYVQESSQHFLRKDLY